MKKYECVVWDFNGTIIDDVEVGIDSVNPLLSARGLKTIDSLDEYREKFDFPIIEYYRALGFDFDAEPYEVIADEWVANYARLSHKIKLTDGVSELINYFKAVGLTQTILSASERDILEKKLYELGLSDSFDEIIALDNVYAHGKIEVASAYFDGRDRSEYLMIGDTVHDADVARAVGIDAFLVACGHHPKHKLLNTGYPVFDNMHTLASRIKSEMSI